MASNRHLGRIVAMQTLYEHDFRGGDTEKLELNPILQRNLDEFRSNGPLNRLPRSTKSSCASASMSS
jgi:hypothetical protein